MVSRDVPHPVWIDRSVVDQALDLTETLVNLNYLICAEADDSARVRTFANHTAERLQTLASLLQSTHGP
jgi:hypothetical protein